MLNRDLVVVRLKQPFVDWVNEADPYSDGSSITLKEINEDLPTFLIHGYASEDKAKAENAELLQKVAELEARAAELEPVVEDKVQEEAAAA